MGRRAARTFAIAFLTLGSVIAAGCGDDSSSSSTSAAGGEDLSGLSAIWTDYGGDAVIKIREAYADPVAAQGMDVRFDEPTDYAKLKTQVDTGNVSWTVVQGDPFFSIPNCGKLLEPIADQIDLKQFDQDLITDDCSVPGETYSWLIAYNADEFGDDPPTDWADFFDTEKYPGGRGIFGAYVASGVLEGSLLADGVAPGDVYPLDTDRAFAKLDTIRDDLVFYDTIAQSEQQMKSGDVSMIITVPSVGFGVEQSGSNWAPVQQDSILTWDPYFVPKGANMDAALPLLESIADPAHQENLDNSYPFGPTNLDAAPDPPDDIAKWAPVKPPESIVMDQQYWTENIDPLSTEFLDWVSG